MRLCFPLSFELKAGHLQRKDFHNRTQGRFHGAFGGKEPSRLQVASRKYSGSNLYDSMLPNDLVEEILVDGLVDATKLRTALDKSSWFVKDEEPAWRTIWYSSERPDEVVEAAAVTLLEEFKARAFDRSGEVLHVFTQVLKLSRLGVTGWSVEDTVAACRAYVDDLRAANRLEPPSDGIAALDFSSAYSLGFEGKDTAEFGELITYLSQQRDHAEQDRHPDQAADLLAALKDDPAVFVQQIAPMHGAASKFAKSPVLAKLDAAAFAEALIALSPMQFRQVLLGLSNRYDHSALWRELAEELSWAKAVETALLERASSLPPIGQSRISNNVEWILRPKIGEAESRSQPDLSAR